MSNLSTYPLALIVTRLQIQRQLRLQSAKEQEHYKSISHAAQRIYGRDGIEGLFTGLTSDTAKTIADAFSFFLAYNFLRKSRQRTRRAVGLKHLSIIDELGVGFLASALAKVLTTPIATIVTRKQTNSMSDSHVGSTEVGRDSTRVIAKQIYKEKGVLGFWSGYSASLILTLNPTLTFFFFETLKRIFLPCDKRSSPTPRATFLLAALGKAMASAITYPFSLAKCRMQAWGFANNNDVDDDKGASSRTQKQKQPNVFSMILQIAGTEGVEALYEGLHGELLKGFLGHGFTMMAKDAVHKIVIQIYFALLRLSRRHPYPHSTYFMVQEARDAVDAAQRGAHTLSLKVGEAMKRGG